MAWTLDSLRAILVEYTILVHSKSTDIACASISFVSTSVVWISNYYSENDVLVKFIRLTVCGPYEFKTINSFISSFSKNLLGACHILDLEYKIYRTHLYHLKHIY